MQFSTNEIEVRYDAIPHLQDMFSNAIFISVILYLFPSSFVDDWHFVWCEYILHILFYMQISELGHQLPSKHKDLKNLNFSHIFHMLIGLIRCLILLKIGHIYFPCLQTLASHLHLHNAESKFLDSHKHFVNLYHQTC